MREVLNILIPVWVSTIIAIIFFEVKEKRGVAISIAVIVTLVSTAILLYINMQDSSIEDVSSQQEADFSIWNEIEVNYKLNNYPKMFQIAEENHLMESEEMLNIIGVMYAQGIYYEQDYEQAIRYFEAALTYGELEKTYNNLCLASYIADRQDFEEKDSYRLTLKALQAAEEKKIKSINEWLVAAISSEQGEIVEDGYEYVRKMTTQQQNALFNSICVEVGTYRYYVCTEYEYFDETSFDEETGITVHSNVVAEAKTIEERELPKSVYSYGFLSNFQLFDDVLLYANRSEGYIVTEVFEYEPQYLDDSGNLCFWVDTEEYFTGDIPPEIDEDSRWFISGYDSTVGKRIYRLQVKE